MERPYRNKLHACKLGGLSLERGYFSCRLNLKDLYGKSSTTCLAVLLRQVEGEIIVLCTAHNIRMKEAFLL